MLAAPRLLIFSAWSSRVKSDSVGRRSHGAVSPAVHLPLRFNLAGGYDEGMVGDQEEVERFLSEERARSSKLPTRRELVVLVIAFAVVAAAIAMAHALITWLNKRR